MEKDKCIMEYKFNAVIEIIGINPFVCIPENILEEIFKQAGRNKGPIPIIGKIKASCFEEKIYRRVDRCAVN
jgi:hypothetical protein